MRLFVYPWDLADEGIDETLRRFREWGMDSVAVSANYHAAKLLLPHNPRRKVYFPEDGAVYFPIDIAHFSDQPLRPRESEWLSRHPRLWREIADSCLRHGLRLVAWTICLHNSAMGFAHPEFTVLNAFGDRYYFNLCPSRDEVREYTCRLVREVSLQPGVEDIFVEALHFMDFEHGYHHEMTGTPLSPQAKALLSLCFCDACMRKGKAYGVDMARAQELVQTEIMRSFETCASQEEYDGPGLSRCKDWLLANGLERLLEFRSFIVASLVDQVKRRIPQRLVYFAAKPEKAWINGVDFELLREFADEFEVYHYARGTDGLREDVENIRRLIGDAKLRLILRAGHPDVESAEELAIKIKTLSSLPVDGFSLYNYGQVPLHYWQSLGSMEKS